MVAEQLFFVGTLIGNRNIMFSMVSISILFMKMHIKRVGRKNK